MMTLTDRRRFPILIAAIAVLALAAAALGLLLSTVQAQEAGTLVSNIDQGGTTTREFSVPYAQRFTTGPYEYGYTLSTVLDIVSADAEGTNFSACEVCTVDGATGHPTSICHGPRCSGQFRLRRRNNYLLRALRTVEYRPRGRDDLHRGADAPQPRRHNSNVRHNHCQRRGCREGGRVEYCGHA